MKTNKYEKNELYIRDFFNFLKGELISAKLQNQWLEQMIREIGTEDSLAKTDKIFRKRVMEIIRSNLPNQPGKVKVSKANAKLFSSDSPKKITLDGNNVILNPVIEIDGIYVIPYDFDDMEAFTALKKKVDDLKNLSNAVNTPEAKK